VQGVQAALVDLAQDPLQRRVLRRGGHLGERRVLLLEAVGAGQVALQRGHQRDVHGAGNALACLVEVRADSGVVLAAIPDKKAVFDKNLLGLSFLLGRRLFTGSPAGNRT
jgi:hypothetical protein